MAIGSVNQVLHENVGRNVHNTEKPTFNVDVDLVNVNITDKLQELAELIAKSNDKQIVHDKTVLDLTISAIVTEFTSLLAKPDDATTNKPTVDITHTVVETLDDLKYTNIEATVKSTKIKTTLNAAADNLVKSIIKKVILPQQEFFDYIINNVVKIDKLNNDILKNNKSKKLLDKYAKDREKPIGNVFQRIRKDLRRLQVKHIKYGLRRVRANIRKEFKASWLSRRGRKRLLITTRKNIRTERKTALKSFHTWLFGNSGKLRTNTSASTIMPARKNIRTERKTALKNIRTERKTALKSFHTWLFGNSGKLLTNTSASTIMPTNLAGGFKAVNTQASKVRSPTVKNITNILRSIKTESADSLKYINLYIKSIEAADEPTEYIARADINMSEQNKPKKRNGLPEQNKPKTRKGLSAILATAIGVGTLATIAIGIYKIWPLFKFTSAAEEINKIDTTLPNVDGFEPMPTHDKTTDEPTTNIPDDDTIKISKTIDEGIKPIVDESNNIEANVAAGVDSELKTMLQDDLSVDIDNTETDKTEQDNDTADINSINSISTAIDDIENQLKQNENDVVYHEKAINADIDGNSAAIDDIENQHSAAIDDIENRHKQNKNDVVYHENAINADIDGNSAEEQPNTAPKADARATIYKSLDNATTTYTDLNKSTKKENTDIESIDSIKPPKLTDEETTSVNTIKDKLLGDDVPSAPADEDALKTKANAIIDESTEITNDNNPDSWKLRDEILDAATMIELSTNKDERIEGLVDDIYDHTRTINTSAIKLLDVVNTITLPHGKYIKPTINERNAPNFNSITKSIDKSLNLIEETKNRQIAQIYKLKQLETSMTAKLDDMAAKTEIIVVTKEAFDMVTNRIDNLEKEITIPLRAEFNSSADIVQKSNNIKKILAKSNPELQSSDKKVR